MLLAYNAVDFRLTLKDEVIFAYEGNLTTQNAMVYDHVLIQIWSAYAVNLDPTLRALHF